MEGSFAYAVIGTGAIGGYYGALLQRSGKEVHFLLHSDYDHVRKHGLTVLSPKGDFTLPEVRAYQDPCLLPRCDVAIVALKATANPILPNILPHVVNENGIVLLLQNGLGQEEPITAIAGVKTVISGLCFICSTKTTPGTICHQDYGSVILCQYAGEHQAGGITPAMIRIAKDLALAGVSVDMNPDLIEARWRKLVWNIPFSGLTTLFQVDTARIVNSPSLRGLATDVMHEVLDGAAALDRHIPESFIDTMMTTTRKMRPYFPSMKLDLDAGRVMELDAMFRKPIEVAFRKGKKLIRVEMLYEELNFLQEKG